FSLSILSFLFFFTAPATPAISTLSLHDALPISDRDLRGRAHGDGDRVPRRAGDRRVAERVRAAVRARPCRRVDDRDDRRHALDRDRKSTRLNSSHVSISYAVFCLKKKKKKKYM